jgi:hypothetical protein
MIKRENVPDGWWFDAADPSVGIMSGQWIHDDCPTLQGPGNGQTLGVEETTTSVGGADQHGMATVTYLLDCKDCGNGVTFDNDEFVGLDDAA